MSETLSQLTNEARNVLHGTYAYENNIHLQQFEWIEIYLDHLLLLIFFPIHSYLDLSILSRVYDCTTDVYAIYFKYPWTSLIPFYHRLFRYSIEIAVPRRFRLKYRRIKIDQDLLFKGVAGVELRRAEYQGCSARLIVAWRALPWLYTSCSNWTVIDGGLVSNARFFKYLTPDLMGDASTKASAHVSLRRMLEGMEDGDKLLDFPWHIIMELMDYFQASNIEWQMGCLGMLLNNTGFRQMDLRSTRVLQEWLVAIVGKVRILCEEKKISMLLVDELLGSLLLLLRDDVLLFMELLVDGVNAGFIGWILNHTLDTGNGWLLYLQLCEYAIYIPGHGNLRRLWLSLGELQHGGGDRFIGKDGDILMHTLRKYQNSIEGLVHGEGVGVGRRDQYHPQHHQNVHIPLIMDQ